MYKFICDIQAVEINTGCHRAPGMVGAALDSGDLWCSIIADGHHVDAATLRIALRAKQPPGRLFLISDAMSTVGDAGDAFTLNGRTVTRTGGRLTLADGTLAGSDLDMASAVRFVLRECGVERAEALRMASLYPAKLLRKDDRYGRIRPGCRADFVHLSDDYTVQSVWVGGEKV